MRALIGWLSQSRGGPVTAVIASWVVASGTMLTLYLIAAARSVIRIFEDIGYRTGATSLDIHASFGDAWLEIGAGYLGIVILPAVLFFILWRRARSS